MLHRILFILVTLFFVVMNVLLWRTEFGGGNEPGSAVPAEKVWQKILIAPDNSTLEIQHHGKRIGMCKWDPNIGEELATGRQMTEDLPPEGMVRTLSSYSIDFEGDVSFAEFKRLHFNFDLKLTTNQVWQEMGLRLKLRPLTWEIRTRAVERTVRFTTDEHGKPTERVIPFDDFRNPDKLLRQLGGSVLADTLMAMGIPVSSARSQTNAAPSWGLNWEARNDWFQIGKTRMRVYRLQARLLDRFQAVIIVSPVGEILRVELPDEIVFLHAGLMN